MAFTPMNRANFAVGKPTKKDIFDIFADNLDDHEARLIALASGSGKISLINESFEIGSNDDQYLIGAKYYRVIQDCIVTEGSFDLFLKAPATSGTLTIDVKKNTSTNPSGFTSLFTSPPSINISSATDYQRVNGTINPSTQALLVGDIIKVDITSLPSGLQGFHFTLIGEF
jgi:hypothetical protein